MKNIWVKKIFTHGVNETRSFFVEKAKGRKNIVRANKLEIKNEAFLSSVILYNEICIFVRSLLNLNKGGQSTGNIIFISTQSSIAQIYLIV